MFEDIYILYILGNNDIKQESTDHLINVIPD